MHIQWQLEIELYWHKYSELFFALATFNLLSRAAYYSSTVIISSKNRARHQKRRRRKNEEIYRRILTCAFTNDKECEEGEGKGKQERERGSFV